MLLRDKCLRLLNFTIFFDNLGNFSLSVGDASELVRKAIC